MTDNILCERFPSDRQNADITPSSSRDFDTLTGHMESTISSKRGRKLYARKTLLLFSLLLPMTSAQTSPNCIGLAASRTCPSWSSSFISLLNIEKFPFLRFVNTTEQFDNEFERYIRTDYTKSKFLEEMGCPIDNLSNTTDLYARYTRSQLCSAMIQESIAECGLTDDNSKPLCVEHCAEWARSEYNIVSDKEACGETTKNYVDSIRSDFIICSLPQNALVGSKCINADANEGLNCGFSDNLPGLCLYCAEGTEDSTDTCCYNSNVVERCKNVELPNITSVPPDLLPTPTTTPIPSDIPAPPDDDKNGLSGGAIAGIVVGSIAAIALLVFFLFWRRRRQAQGHEGYLNRPSPMRNSPQRNMGYAGGEAAEEHRGYEVLAGGRIARMSALEAANASVSDGASPPPVALGTRGRREGSHRVIHNNSTEFAMDDSPNTGRRTKYSTPERESRPPRPPPRDRNASLSSTSILVSDHHHSDSEKEGSPVVTSPASEQLPYFKDYYSKDDIHPNDKVACLWAYSPRAADEFELERGDMLQVIGIWDDGWATGIRLDERAEDFVRIRNQRDSGVSASQASRISRDRSASSPTPGSGEVKAFPLVCVCLPEHWQKTIENDGQQSDFASRARGSMEQRTREGRLSDPESSTSPSRKIQERPSSRFHEDLNPPPDSPN